MFAVQGAPTGRSGLRMRRGLRAKKYSLGFGSGSGLDWISYGTLVTLTSAVMVTVV